MRFTMSIVVLAAQPLALGARGDVFILQQPGNTVVTTSDARGFVVPSVEEEISMDAETVEIAEGPSGGFDVTCTFTLRSHSAEERARTVAFPVDRPGNLWSMEREFRVVVDGAEVATKLEKNADPETFEGVAGEKPDDDAFEYAGFVTWPVTWRPGEVKSILCTYPMGETEVFGGLGRGWRLRYVVRTGSLWRGAIGRADIRIKFRSDPRHERRGVAANDESADTKSLFRTTYPDRTRWESDTEICWHFEDWEPTEDLVVERSEWVGLGERFKPGVPEPYVGAKDHYTAETLDKLVDELMRGHVQFWASRFPRQTAELDRGRMKSIIAECLYREIYARHGDPFLLSKKPLKEIPDDEDWPEGVSSASDDEEFRYYFGEWHDYFEIYRWHGGWYDADVDLKERVELSELNEIERANLTFLGRYFEE